MGIDVNDLKFLINTCFKYLIKTCHQWAKDHPLVSGVLLFFYLLYIFFPYLFSLLFYTFPLIICIAIILGAKHISSKQNQEQLKNSKKYDILRTMTIDHRYRPRFSSHMRSQTMLGPIDGSLLEESFKCCLDNFPASNRFSSQNETVPTKTLVDVSTTTSSCVNSEKTSPTHASQHTSMGISSHSDTDSQDEDEHNDEQAGESRKRVVEWTEDDQRNLMDLGSSEIERNKRLESLIAKRRARKQLSMQPIRLAHHPYENLMEQVGSIMGSRCIDHDAEQHQPGSAPCALRPTRNPFDLPYGLHEERPVLTGGSFDDEVFGNATKELATEVCSIRHEVNDDPVILSMPSFFTKPKSVEKMFTRFRRESEENMAEMFDPPPSKKDANNVQVPNLQAPPKKAQLNPSFAVPKEEHHGLENPFATDFEPAILNVFRSSEMTKKNETETKDENVNNSFRKDSEVVKQAEVEPLVQDHVTINEDVGHDDDDDSISSSSSSTDVTINAIKNEAFRNSVKKVLNCLVIQRNKANLNNKNTYRNASPSNGRLFDSIPANISPTKMEERSFYTSRPHHATTFSIASDMQVEVSDTGSPPLATLDPSSPTDRESLVYDGDVDKDANSGDEELWGASPHPNKAGEFASKFKLQDITEEGNNDIVGSEQLSGERTTFSPRKTVDQDQRSIDAEIIGSVSPVSSSSDSLVSHMQAKSEHLAEYLANLPPTENGPNVLEDTEPSQVEEPSAEDPTILALEEARDGFGDSEEMRQSRKGLSDRRTITSGKGALLEETNVTPSTRECAQDEATHQGIHIGELDNPWKTIEDESSLVENDVSEDKSYFGEPISHREKETVSDSFSTTCQEELLEQSRLVEERSVKLEDNMPIQDDGEVKEHTVDNSLNHDNYTLIENVKDDQENHATFDENRSEQDEASIEREVKSREVENVPQPSLLVEKEDATLDRYDAENPANHVILDEKEPEHDEPSIENEVKVRGVVEDVPQPNLVERDESTLNEDVVEDRAHSVIRGEKESKHDEPSTEREVKLKEVVEDRANHHMLPITKSEQDEPSIENEVKLREAVEDAPRPSSVERDKSTLNENVVQDRANHVTLEEKEVEHDESSNENEVKLREVVEDVPRPSSVEKNGSTLIENDVEDRANNVVLPKKDSEQDDPSVEGAMKLQVEDAPQQGLVNKDESTLIRNDVEDQANHVPLDEIELKHDKPGTESEVKLREVEDSSQPSLAQKEESILIGNVVEDRANHAPLDEKELEHDMPSVEDEVKLREAEDAPRPSFVEEDESTLIENAVEDQATRVPLDKKEPDHDEPSADREVKLREIEDAPRPTLAEKDEPTLIEKNGVDNHTNHVTSHARISEHQESPIIQSEVKSRELIEDVPQPSSVDNNKSTLIENGVEDQTTTDVTSDKNVSKNDEQNIENEVKSREVLVDAPQPTTIEEDDSAPSSSTEAASSIPTIDEPELNNSDHPKT